MHQAAPISVKNDVIKWQEKNFRVIKVNLTHTFLFALDSNNGLPIPFNTNELEYSFESGEVVLLEEHKYHALPASLNFREKAHIEMTERYEVIKSVVESEGVLNSSERGRLIRSEMIRRNISKTKIYRILRAYWTFGQCIEAVSSHYHKCEAKGKQRQLTDQKPERKRHDGRKENAIRTDLHTQFMHRVIVTFYFGKKYSLTKTYRRFVIYCKNDDSNTSDDNIPSIESLRHILKSCYSIKHTYIRKIPLTLLFLNRYAGSVTEYQIRRITYQLLTNPHRYITRKWFLLRAAGLSDERLTTMTKQFLNSIGSSQFGLDLFFQSKIKNNRKGPI
tara:strand:- start:524 stop:1522 length:999 start_codon:yes stop_codon:yes gene_type:complete